ncbi:hypothetical protein BKA64DRAFT_763810 [Cadophora sp. MPI-SDFR-AT-0126]|nr:hypothetical protein BKA64DRAFT_763810 [Leotiomycetes sp. MPI-SDFR-AT-0126]
MTAKEKEKIERQKVERFISSAKYRRIYLDQEMDGRIDRVKCEDEEERCDMCCESDAMMEELEAKRQAHVEEARKEQEKQGRLMDSAIDIPSSSIRVSSVRSNGLDSSDGPFPSSPSAYSQSSTVSFNQGFAADQISPAEREEFQSQQIQRQQQRLYVQEHNQQEGHDIWDLENRLDMWHTLDECVDPEKGLVASEVEALKGIHFERYASCYDCGVAQQICTRWEEIREGNKKFQRIPEGVCQYNQIVRQVVAAIMVAGPSEVTDQEVWSHMRTIGIWGVNQQLDPGEKAEVKNGILK